MNTSLLSYIFKLTIFSVFTFLIIYFLQKTNLPYFQTTIYWLIWLFFVISTFSIHAFLIKKATNDPKKFILAFMGITGLKLFGYLIIIVIYALLKREAALGFTICFLILYLFYTAFEVFVLYKQLQKK